MSDYRFGDDYKLNIYPKDAIDCWGEIDINKVESVEIERVDFIRKPDDKSRYHELFGTPERAAHTWIKFNGIYRCVDCPICNDDIGVTCEIPGECAWEDEEGGYDALLEWLKGDTE